MFRFVLSPFIAFIFLRLLNSFLVKTFFQPDEYFQSLEPAWALAFGPDSGAWITWEWKQQIRSALYPVLFAANYKVAAFLARLLRLSTHSQSTVLLAAPKLLQGLIAGSSDYFTYKTARNVYATKSSARTTAILTTLSAWQCFCSARTLSNSLETTLTAAALSYWPWVWSFRKSTDRDESVRKQSVMVTARTRISLTFAAIACVLRPTNVLIWLCLALPILVNSDMGRRVAFLTHVFTQGAMILVLNALVDRSFYGKWTFPPLQFLYFNLVQSLSVFYGANDWHYYLSQGIPILLTTYLPLGIIGFYEAMTRRTSISSSEIEFQLACTFVVVVTIFSVISHKEVRFISPLLPILHILCIGPASGIWSWISTRPKSKFTLLIAFALIQSTIVYYVTTQHQVGVIKVMDVLREEYEELFNDKNMTVGFLMPCHSTPWRSHLIHSRIQGWALTCEPPVDMNDEEKTEYVDEADRFYGNPQAFLLPHSREEKPWPDYLVIFDHLRVTLEGSFPPLQESYGLEYSEKFRLFNTHWHDDRRRKGDIVVYAKSQHRL